jgi:phosphatidylserine decarboxylase
VSAPTPRILLQYLLPHRLLSRLVMWATRWTWRPWKDWLIRRIVVAYDVELSEAQEPRSQAYPHYNAFFTRALKPGARPADPDPRSLLMPADGYMSQFGPIRDGRIFQAKGHDFSAAELLADADAAAPFANGHFATVYLSPRDYHRVHMPWAGTLRRTVHVPGRIFSVAPFAVGGIPRLFARNERLVCHFDTDFGPMVVVLVGAIMVSGVETVWRGVEIPPYASRIVTRDYADGAVRLERFAEMGRFNMGSTVIVLVPPLPGFAFDPQLRDESTVKVGQRLALLGG